MKKPPPSYAFEPEATEAYCRRLRFRQRDELLIPLSILAESPEGHNACTDESNAPVSPGVSKQKETGDGTKVNMNHYSAFVNAIQNCSSALERMLQICFKILYKRCKRLLQYKLMYFKARCMPRVIHICKALSMRHCKLGRLD